MSKTKNHNSILFLTTLGLYIGLVIVGASPQILAQAATTRNFTISDEIEVKDDLDKKPDGDDLPDLRSIDIAQALIDFSEDLVKLQSIGKYDPASYKTFTKQDHYTIGRQGCQHLENEWVRLAGDELFQKLFVKNFETIIDKSQAEGVEKYVQTSARLKVDFDPANFELQALLIKSSPERASLLAEHLTALFRLKANTAEDPRVKLIYENTRLTTTSNQIMIVTRLPRGSIDQLLRS